LRDKVYFDNGDYYVGEWAVGTNDREGKGLLFDFENLKFVESYFKANKVVDS